MRTDVEAVEMTEDAEPSRRLPLVLWALLAYLAAIITFGKGPTYLGIGPLFWGEAVVFALVAWTFWRMYIERTPVKALLTSGGSAVLAFMCLGAVLTAIGYRAWGVDALRDAAIWYYGAFFFVGLHVARHRYLADSLWGKLQIVWLLALVWCVADTASGGRLAQAGPMVPARGVPLLGGSGSENLQNMMLGAVLVILGAPSLRRLNWCYWVLYLLVVAGIGFFVTSPGRGARLAVAGGILVAFVATLKARPPIFPTRKLLWGGLAVAVVVVVLTLAVGPDDLASITHLERFREASGENLAGTAYWRMVWWENIIAAMHKHNPVFGLGLGADLSALNPFVDNASDPWPLRSPHNFNMTVLARMGYAGLTLWLVVLVGGLGRLFVRLRRGGLGGRQYTPERRKELAFWLLMLVATWINASFGVLMEGPVLGIPFWFFLGFATRRSMGPDGFQPAADDAVRDVESARPLLLG